MTGLPWLAEMQVQDALSGWTGAESGVMQMLIIFGAIALVAALAFGWAAFFRSRKRRRHHHHHHHAKPQTTRTESVETPGKESRRSRRRHRSRHEYGRRNPTLAEAGGLPPIRPEDQPPPSV